jgi:hypothetical protein
VCERKLLQNLICLVVQSVSKVPPWAEVRPPLGRRMAGGKVRDCKYTINGHKEPVWLVSRIAQVQPVVIFSLFPSLLPTPSRRKRERERERGTGQSLIYVIDRSRPSNSLTRWTNLVAAAETLIYRRASLFSTYLHFPAQLKLYRGILMPHQLNSLIRHYRDIMALHSSSSNEDKELSSLLSQAAAATAPAASASGSSSV